MLNRQVEQFLARDTSLDKQSVHAFADQGLEWSFQRLSRPSHDRLDLHADALRGLANLRHIRLGEGISLVSKHADASGGGNKLADQLHTFAAVPR
jgi:hypothetical protein